MRFFRIGKRRKELVETLSNGRGIYRNTFTLRLDAEAERELDSRQKIVIPGKVIDDRGGRPISDGTGSA
jgi:hypothetical protein